MLDLIAFVIAVTVAAGAVLCMLHMLYVWLTSDSPDDDHVFRGAERPALKTQQPASVRQPTPMPQASAPPTQGHTPRQEERPSSRHDDDSAPMLMPFILPSLMDMGSSTPNHTPSPDYSSPADSGGGYSDSSPSTDCSAGGDW